MKLSHLHYASLGDDPYASPNQSQKVMREQENNLEDGNEWNFILNFEELGYNMDKREIHSGLCKQF